MKLPVNYNDTHYTIRKQIRIQYAIEQNNLCHHCKSNLDKEIPDEMKKYKINKELFPKGMFTYPIHLHHDRKTGLTVGAVHAKCNAILWQYYGE